MLTRALAFAGAIWIVSRPPAAAQHVPPGCRLVPQRYLRLIDRSATHDLVIEVGPVDVPAHSMAPHQRELTYQLAFAPLSGWIHGFHVEVMDSSGHALPRWLLHHIVTARAGNRELFLPVTQRFIGVGLETRGRSRRSTSM